MRVHVLVSVPLTRTRLSRPSPDCAFIHVITCSHSTLEAVGAHGRVGAHVHLDYLYGGAYVRVPVFFVWQHSEAPKEWPWLMKNQR